MRVESGQRPLDRLLGWRRHAPAIVLLAAIAIAILVPALGRADEVPDPGYVVTASSPTTNLSDAQRVTINVRSRADIAVLGVQIRQCRVGEAYADRSDYLPTGGKCPNGPVSSSADTIVARGLQNAIIQTVQSPAGATLGFRVGIGVTQWQATEGPLSSLTCDADHDCVLVVQIQLGTGFKFFTIPLDFANPDPIAGCGGPAQGIVMSAGSDRLSDAYGVWTRDACELPGAAGAPTNGSFPSEGEAMNGFGDGSLDLAYTAVGYDSAVDLRVAADPPTPRPGVAVPLALNAAVIAVGGGKTQLTGDKAPYQDIRLKPGEIAAIFGGGIPRLLDTAEPYGSDIKARNPELNDALFINGLIRPAAPAKAEATSWFVSNYLEQLSPDAWASRLPRLPRGATGNFARADPAFLDLDLYSGRAILGKTTNNLSFPGNDGPLWVLTDLATARALGLTPVSIENANGDFVAPTAESMTAALAAMKPDENGLLISDPKAAVGVGGVSATATVQPYPLTFVEYALAPAEPLIDAGTCTPRTESQQLLGTWLQYVTGDGQKVLPAGLLALPSTLSTEAAQAITRVGASPATGKCASTVTPPPDAVPGVSTSASGPPAGAGVAAGAAPVTGAPSAVRGPTGLAGGAPVAAAAAPAPDVAVEAALAAGPSETAIAVPAFAGYTLPDNTGGVVALLGIVLVTSLAAWLTAGPSASGGTVALAGAAASSTAGMRLPTRPPTWALAALWFGVAATGVGLVVYQLGPLLQQRDQHDLIAEYKPTLRKAANAGGGLQRAVAVDTAPEEGAAVGVLEIGGLRSQSVVVEGVTPTQTRKGPGHVPGTAGLGQPGNAVVVARRNGYGGTFGNLEAVRKGQRILVSTTQGQSVYRVKSVHEVGILDGSAEAETTPVDLTGKKTKAAGTTSSGSSNTVTTEKLYGPSDDDRLTLVTSASRAFWNTSDAVVVVAKLQGTPFEPTQQGARTDSETGRQGESGVWASVALALLLYGAAIAASVALYRRMRFRIAYVLTVAPLVALTIITGETLSRLLPAWM